MNGGNGISLSEESAEHASGFAFESVDYAVFYAVLDAVEVKVAYVGEKAVSVKLGDDVCQGKVLEVEKLESACHFSDVEAVAEFVFQLAEDLLDVHNLVFLFINIVFPLNV